MTENDILLEGPIATWNMGKIDGEIGGTYSGTFQFRCFLDPIRQLQAGREFREMIGPFGVNATTTEYNMAYALTQLKHRVIKAPPFWTSTRQDSQMDGNIPDLNILMAVLSAAERAEAAYTAKVQKEREELLEKSIKMAEEKLQKESVK